MPSSSLMPHAISWHEHQPIIWTILVCAAIACLLFLLLNRRTRNMTADLNDYAARLARADR